MNYRQLSKKSMYERISNFFDTHATLFSAFAPLQAAITAFFARMTLLETIEQDQIKDTRNLSAHKTTVRKQWTETLATYLRLAKAWALSTNSDLLAQLDWDFDSLMRLPQERAANTGKELVRLLVDNVASLTTYGISRDLLDDLAEKIETYEALVGDAESAIKDRKAATDLLDRTMAEQDKQVVIIDELIKAKYGVSHPSLIVQYGYQREVGNDVRRHTVLQLTLMNLLTNEPYEGARMVIRELNRSAIANIDGFAEIVKFKTGKYHLDIYVGDVLKKTIIVDCPRGKTTQLQASI